MRRKRQEELPFNEDEDIVVGKEWRDSEEKPAEEPSAEEPRAEEPDSDAIAKGKNFFLIALAVIILLGAVGAFLVLPMLFNVDIVKEVGNVLSPQAQQSVQNVTPAQALPKKPSLLSLVIADGETTSSNEVLLKLYAKGAAQCRFSNDGSSWSEWYAYSTQAQWNLSEGDGWKTVYYQCKNKGGVAEAVSAKIFLDKTPPSLSLDVLVQGDKKVFLSAKGSDENPKGFVCKLFVDKEVKDEFSGIYEKYLSLSAGKHEISVLCEDAVGNNASVSKEVNISEEEKEEVPAAGSTSPKISIIINNGDEETNSRYLSLKLYAENASVCRYKEGNNPWTPYEPYTTFKIWTTQATTSQVITIYYECKDKNNVLIGQAYDSIRYVKNVTSSSGGTGSGSGSGGSSGGSSGGGGSGGGSTSPTINSAAIVPRAGSSLASGYTNSYFITLSMDARGVTECRYRNIPWEPEPVWTDWAPYSSSQEIEILGPRGGNGDRLVQIECRNSAGDVVSSEASIIYDDTPPEPVDTARPEDATLIYSEEINGTNHTYVMIVWLPTSDNLAGVYSYNIDRMAMSEGRIRSNYAVIRENGSTFYQYIDEIDPSDTYIYGFTTYDKAGNAAISPTLFFCDPSQPLPANCH